MSAADRELTALFRAPRRINLCSKFQDMFCLPWFLFLAQNFISKSVLWLRPHLLFKPVGTDSVDDMLIELFLLDSIWFPSTSTELTNGSVVRLRRWHAFVILVDQNFHCTPEWFGLFRWWKYDLNGCQTEWINKIKTNRHLWLPTLTHDSNEKWQPFWYASSVFRKNGQSCLSLLVEEGWKTYSGETALHPSATTLLLEGTDRSCERSCYSYELILLCSLKWQQGNKGIASR